MKIVEIECPRSVDLKQIVSPEDNKVKSVLQTVDIYDKVELSSETKSDSDIIIKSNNKLNSILRTHINDVINIFLAYTNVQIDNLKIEIDQNKSNMLFDNCNILSGVLLALNYFYNTELPIHELIYLSQRIDNLIAYYLECGYKKIDYNNKNHNLDCNLYQKYFLIDKANQIDTESISNLIKQYNIEYCDNSNCLCIPIKENISLNNLIAVKKQLANYKILLCENVGRHKVLKKYLNYFE